MSLKPPFLVEVKKPAIKPRDLKVGVVELGRELVSQGQLAGVANTKKYVIGTSFAENGTAKNRENGVYGTFYGNVGNGVEDPFRDAQGKYWTYNEGQTDVIFLNPYVGSDYNNDSALAKSYIPAKIFYNKPEIINAENYAWLEYEQKIYVTPDKDWIFKAFGENFFQSTTVKIKELLGIMDQTEINHNYLSELSAEQIVAAGVANQLQADADSFKSMIKQWWYTKIGVDTAALFGGNFDPTKAGCRTLAAKSGLVTDANETDTVADEICTPWIIPDKPYVDHVVDLFCPIEQNKNDQSQTNLGVRFPYYSLDSEYNFYIRSYERVLQDDNVDEKILPNMYIFAASFLPEATTGELSDYPKYKKIISLSSTLKEFGPNALRIRHKDVLENKNLKKPPASSKQYFTYWSKTVENLLTRNEAKYKQVQAAVGGKQQFMLYPMQDTDILDNYNDQKFMFPMYNELKFSTGVVNVAGDLLRQTALSNHFMLYYAMSSSPKAAKLLNPSSITGDNNNVMASNVPFFEINKTLNLNERLGSTTTVSSEVQVSQESIKVTSVEGFLAMLELPDILFGKYGTSTSNFELSKQAMDEIESFFSTSIQTFTNSSIFISKDESEGFLVTDASNKMQKSMLSMIFYGKLRKMEQKNHRAYSQMMKGDAGHSETIMYIVSKRRVGDRGEVNDVMQEYYFLNSSETDVLTFIDTQVNYDREYQYDIDAVVLSMGMAYEYKNPHLVTDRVVEFIRKFGQPLPSLRKTTDFDAIKQYTKNLNAYNVSVMPNPSATEDGKKYEGQLKTFSEGDPRTQVGTSNPRGNSDVDTAAVLQTVETRFGGDEAEAGALQKDLVDYSSLKLDPENLFDPQALFDTLVSDEQMIPDIKLVEGNSLTTEITVRYRANYKLLRTRYASVSGRILDKPPVFPDALITPYKGKNDKLLITLNQNVGEYFMKPIFIRPEEYDLYQKQLTAQKIKAGDLDATPAIEYKSDDSLGAGGYFEVYRLNKKPSTYYDFQNNLLTTIDGYHELEVGHMESDSAAFRDDIKPNRKYYYMFRVVDVHGNVSNPSSVFEIEMVDDGGTVYLVQDIVELEEPNIKEVSKGLKKYLQIKPTFQQSLLNVPSSDSPTPSAFDYGVRGVSGDIRLGTAQEAIWGKKFKIRITSKSSGKQIDLNVTFSRTEDAQAADGTEGKYYSKPRP